MFIERESSFQKRRNMSHDTTRGEFKEPCSDCGGPSAFRHTGALVPPGTVGYFCPFCFNHRHEAWGKDEPPKPLGVKPPGEPSNFKDKPMKVTTKSGAVYTFDAPDEKEERHFSSTNNRVGFENCKILLLEVGKDMWIVSTDGSADLWSTTKVVSIT